MTDHDLDGRITDALRAYEASIPEEELAMTARATHRRSRWPIGVAAVVAGTIAGVALAIVLLNRPDAPVGAEDLAPTPTPSASASATADGTAGPSPSATATPLSSDSGPEARDGWTTAPIGVSSPANVNGVTPWGDGLILLGRSESTLGGIWLSEDGRTWTAAVVPDSPEGTAVFVTAAAQTLAGFAAVGTLGHPEGSGPMGSVLWTATDGRTWSEPPTASGVRDRLLSVVATSGSTVVAAGNAIWRSIDGGASWTEVVAPGSDGWTLTDLVIHEDRFVGTGYLGYPISGPSGAAIWTSEDGATWDRVELGGQSATSLAPLPDGGLLVVGSGDNEVRAWVSADGTSWQAIEIEAPCCITDVAATPTGVVGIGFGPQGGAVSVATTDAVRWTQEADIAARIDDLIYHPRFGLVGGGADLVGSGADAQDVPAVIFGPHPYP